MKLPSILGKNPYSQFLVDCFQPPENLDVQYLKNILTNVGCDEYLLAGILCTAAAEKLNSISEMFQSHTRTALAKQVEKKTSPGGTIRKFLLVALQTQRPTDTTSTDTVIAESANLLIEYGLVPPTVIQGSAREHDLIFQVVTSLSRSSCDKVDAWYREKFNGQGLAAAISHTFKGSVAFALALWTASSRARAVAMLLHRLLPATASSKRGDNSLDAKVKRNDSMRTVTHILAKYDHWEMSLIRSAYTHLYDESLSSRIEGVITGKYQRAVHAWITCEKTCDGGYERQIENVVSSLRGDPS
jgi:hypothetical protein